MCIQFFQIWREHDVVCMWAVCVNVQTLENHPEMQNIIACIYIYMHCISRHALSQTCIYMYMHGISHSGRGSGFQMSSSPTVTVTDWQWRSGSRPGWTRDLDMPPRRQLHQQSGQCIYITNMQNLNPALFCILILGFAYYNAYWCIYMQNNMHNMLYNMQINSAGFRFCIFCILQYAKYAKYAKKYAKICNSICSICKIICKIIVQGVYSAYFAYCNMQNMQNMPWYYDDFCVFCILLHIFFHILHIFCTFLHIAAYFLPYSTYFLAYCFIFSFWNAALASTGNVWHDQLPAPHWTEHK